MHINSIGCPNCRPKYYDMLKGYLNQHKDCLCEDCLNRLDRNPMRILDCKQESCKKVAADAPIALDYLCDDCREHFEKVKTYLDDMGIAYEIDTNIVRGLDYYTKTVFEFVSTNIGAQGTICGGGRYDGLISQLGGQATPGMGFGCGLERLIMVMEAVDAPFPEPPKADIYLAPLGDEADRPVQKLVYDLRQLGVSAERDLVGRGLRAQMKHADRIGARFSAVIGDGELESKVLRVKNMETGEQTETELTAEANCCCCHGINIQDKRKRFFMNTSIHGMKRTVWCGELRAADAEKEVTVNGWCERTRDNGGVLFLLLRDRTGTIQCTFDKSVNAELFDIAFGVRTEYVLAIRGKVVLRDANAINKKMPTGEVEIAVTDIRVLFKSGDHSV